MKKTRKHIKRINAARTGRPSNVGRASNSLNAAKAGKSSDVVRAVKEVDRKLEIEKFGKLISTRPTRVAKSKKQYDRKDVKRQLKDILRRLEKDVWAFHR